MGNAYTSFSGSQIVCVMDKDILTGMQAVSCSVTAEKAPIFLMGKREFQGSTTNKLAAAGSLVALVSKDDPLSGLLTDKKVTLPPSDQKADYETLQSASDIPGEPSEARYAFEIDAFNILLVGVNLQGDGIKKTIEDVGLINEGFVTGIDEASLQMTYAFIAQRASQWKKIQPKPIVTSA